VLPTASAPTAANEGASTTKPASEPTPAAPKPTLTEGTPSPDPTAPLPQVAIAAPVRDQVVASTKAAEFAVRLQVKNWQTEKGANHVHLILDNKPYKAIYDTKAPIKLSELTGGEALTDGYHVLVAFPSRSNHESVKTKGALAIVPFWIGKKDPVVAKSNPTTKPMLIYSRPKGDYAGAMADHLLVDFQLANTKLAEGKHHVRVTLDGDSLAAPLSANVTSFGTPLYADHLPGGTYTVKVELLDSDDKLVGGPWNTTTRTITVTVDRPAASATPASPADDAHHGH